MIHIFKKHCPLIIGIGVLWVTIAVLLTLSVRQNQGHLVYALDDSYIHMAMAKNIAKYVVWGVDKYNFSSSSSSPLWLSSLALVYFLFGENEVSPFILNFIFATLIVLGIYFFLRKYTSQPIFTLIIFVSIIFLTPLVPLVFGGQEHTMHAFLTILFVYFSAKILSIETFKKPFSTKNIPRRWRMDENGKGGGYSKPLIFTVSHRFKNERSTSNKEYILLLILAPLITLARYESLFLVLVVSVLFILRRRLLHSLLLGVLGVLPILIYGLISISNGWYFLPNPILMKGNMPELFSLSGIINSLGYAGLKQTLGNPHILTLLIGGLIVFILRNSKENRLWKDPTIMIIIFVATVLLHMQFARTGWFFRYEAYLVALGIFVIAIGICEYIPPKFTFKIDRRQIPKYTAITLVMLLLLSPLGKRAKDSLKYTPQATTNIYEQQYQMGLFLREFYQGKTIAANDIGAIDYLADIAILDLWGLANMDVAKLIREGSYDTQQIYDLAKQKNVKIAIVYDIWFEIYGGIPSQWIKVGEWKIPNNVVCGSDTVSFYAVDPLEKDNLIDNLRSFSSHLPKDVANRGVY
jgi:hypothetical protein